MGRLFGTDGIRGIANKELTSELALGVGRSSAIVLTKHLSHTPKILIGKDTRISCDMLESALASGICSVGADAEIIGVVPTPAVAYLVKKYNADAGIMISASHNPAKYNGIKLFSADGYKLPDSIEDEIESLLLDHPDEITSKMMERTGKITIFNSAVQDYIDHIKTVAGVSLKGLTVAIDCANGSASVTAKLLFESLGADCRLLSCDPDGLNINKDCGSTHLNNLKAFVIANRCDVGVAFDGDADRCLMVDELGKDVDGDKLIAMASLYLKQKGRLLKNTAVVTVMSNLGFFHFAKENEINVLSTKVGDRYVLEEMLSGGYSLGGEQSGHIIFLDHSTTGDGQMTAAILLSVLAESKKKFSQLSSVMESYPQVLMNVQADDKEKEFYQNDRLIRETIANYENILGNDGRILVRASGTEPLIRVMIEGKEQSEIERIASDIAQIIKDRISQI